MFDYHAEHDDDLVEILDEADQPFMVSSLAQAHKQGLCFQVVITLLHGQDKKNGLKANLKAGDRPISNLSNEPDYTPGIYVQQRSKFSLYYPEFWDVSAIRHVRAGESREEAATRSLYEELGVRCTHCTCQMNLRANSRANLKDNLKTVAGYEHLNLAIFHALAPAVTPAPDHKGIANLLCLTPSELEILLRDFKQQITPALRLVWEAGLAFP